MLPLCLCHENVKKSEASQRRICYDGMAGGGPQADFPVGVEVGVEAHSTAVRRHPVIRYHERDEGG